MARPTSRIERTLSSRSFSADAHVDTGSTTVIDLKPINLESVTGDSEAVLENPRFTEPTPDRSEPRAGSIRSAPAWASPAKTALKAALWIVALPFLCILPFIAVLRIAVVSYHEDTLVGWEAFGIGLIVAVVLVCVYIAVFTWSFGFRRALFMPLMNICLTAMLFYCGYTLYDLATTNAKTAEVRSYYTSLHPFLRVAVKNLTLFDDDLVITDIHRTAADYRSMGLPTRAYSLHFRQPTGFVHAMDIRTRERSKLANLLIELYFVLMGFETIRHVGTADHLHVSLTSSPADQ